MGRLSRQRLGQRQVEGVGLLQQNKPHSDRDRRFPRRQAIVGLLEGKPQLVVPPPVRSMPWTSFTAARLLSTRSTVAIPTWLHVRYRQA